MKTTKKALSVLLAVIMIMSSMSVCFGSISFTAAAEGDPIGDLKTALESDVVTKAGNTDNNDGVKVTTSGATNAASRTVTIETSTYAAYVELKDTLILLDNAIKSTDEYKENAGVTKDYEKPRSCTSTEHIYNELTESLKSAGLSLTTERANFILYALRSEGSITHASPDKKEKGWFSNPSSSKTPDTYTNKVIVKTTDYKGYLATRGAYTNVESTINLGYEYTVKMVEGYFETKTSGWISTTYWHFHNMMYTSSTPLNAPSVHTAANKTDVRSTLDSHVNAINAFTAVSYDELLAKVSAGTIDTFLSDFETAVSTMQTYVGGASTYNKLFSSFATDVANQKASIQSAKDMQNYLPIVENYQNFIAANPDYGRFSWGANGGANNWGIFGEKGSATHAKMEADYATFKSYYDSLVAGGSVLDYFVSNGDIDMQYYYAFTDNYKVYYLNDSKNAADAFYAEHKDTFKDYTTEEQTALLSTVTGFLDAIPAYRSNVRGGELQVINAIYNEGYNYLRDMKEDLTVEINEFVLYFAENAHKSFAEFNTKSVWAKLDEAIAKRNGLNAFYNTLSSARRDQLLGQLITDANHMIQGLYQLLGNRFTAEVDSAYAVYTELGKPSTVTVETFLKLNAVLLAIEVSIMNDLDGRNQGGYITSATRAKYEEMKTSIIPVCDAYRTTYGFNDYKQTYIADKTTGIYPEDRGLYTGDEVKTQPYVVDKAKMNQLIAALDKIINSDVVGGLLGGLLGVEEGQEFNLGNALSDLIKGALFSDAFINTVVQLLYPLVQDEFQKVFDGLPMSINYLSTDIDVRYHKELNNVLDETGFYAMPYLMAKSLDASKYANNIDALTKAKQNWESAEIRDPETKKLTLVWGVDEQKERLENGEITMEEFETFFYNAFEDATRGILPLLAALITNVQWKPVNVPEIARGEKTILLSRVSLQVDLQLGATPNQGYSNLLVPIYEALGLSKDEYTAASIIESDKYKEDISFVLEQILAPIFTFVEKLSTNPVEQILSILPNLIYSTAFNMVPQLLNMLQTVVTYSANEVSVGIGSVMNGGADILVGDMLITDKDDAVLPKSMFQGGLKSILENFGIVIPTINQATLATLGKLVKHDTQREKYVYSGLEGTGKAYFIEADKADVGYYLLSYILGAVKDEQAFTDLLGGFITVKDENGEPIKDADGKTTPDYEAIAKLKETLYNDEGLNLDAIDVGDAIAAIVELANQIEYGIDPYYWYAGENNTPLGTTAAADIYLNPGNDWTEAKAEYLYNNLEGLLNSIFTMAGLDISVEGALADALGGLFSNKTVTGLAKLLGSLSDLGALLAPKAEEDAPEASEPETVAEGEEAGLDIASILTDLLKNELGIDLSVYAPYANLEDDVEIDFGVTDAASFVEALTELLAPLKPVLDFILGGEDLTLIDSAITLHGYKGYDNAIIPLLEALGAAPVAYTENADTLALTLGALVGVINKITTNDPEVAKDGAIYTIIDMLPGVIYYLSSNGLSQGIDKLLTPVYAILDTIRPIYNLDLGTLLAGIEVDFDKDGVKEPLDLDIKNINWSFIFGLLNDLLGLDLSALQQVIYDVCDDIATTYTSKSTLQSTWKKGAYILEGENKFTQADMLTVLLSFVLEWATIEDNAAKLDELLKTNGIISSLKDVFADVEITYGTPNWMYWFEDEAAFDAYIASGEGLPNTLASLEYPDGNEWDLDTAKYFAENIDELVDTVIAMINEGKTDDEGKALPTDLATLLCNLVNGLVNADTLNDLVGMITGLLGDIDENLINTAGYLLDVDLAGLKAYTCEAEIDSISDFINELANVLDKYAGGLINWLFFGDDYRFAKKSDKTDTIVINGGLGYEKGLAMILEALGCDLPEEANTKTVLGALATRIDYILKNDVDAEGKVTKSVVDKVLDLLPNLVYFLNANGAGVAVDNLLQPVYALLEKLSAFGLNVNLADLLKFTKEDGTEIAIDLENLSLENVVTIVESATGLPLDAAEAILVDFCTGKITKGTYIYKMEAAREDVITILLVVALELLSDDAFGTKLDEMLGTDFIAKIKKIFAPSKIEYAVPDWNYMKGKENAGVIEYVNAITSYPNDWTEAKAEYLAANLPALVDTVIGMIEINGVKYESLSALLKANVNVFTTETLNSLLDMIKNLLGGIDDGLLEVGFILDVDLVGLKNYTVEKEITTVEEFALELANVLNTYAKGAVEWLLLGRDFKLIVKDADGIEEGLVTEGSYITINGAQGYAEGLALLLEALGCKNLPEVYGVENLDTAATVTAVLKSLAARINEILEMPVERVLEILPNLIYFLDANGVAVVIENTLAALNGIVDKLSVFGISLDINSLVNLPKLMKIEEKYGANEKKIGLDNLTLVALLRAVSLMTGLDFTELQNVLVPFAIGEAVLVKDSVSKNDTYKMVYKNDLDKHDMLSVIVSAALRMFFAGTETSKKNAAKLDEMLGTDIVSALKDVFASVGITYVSPNWNYMDGKVTDGAITDYVNAIVAYPNDWTEEKAEYLAANLPALVDTVIKMIEINGVKYESLSALLNTLLADANVFSTKNLQAIVDLIAGLLKDIDDGLLEAAGVLLGVDVVGLKAYKAPEDIDTAAEFAAELANVLNTYAKGVIEWLLLGKDYKFFVKEVATNENGEKIPVDFIVINGANGYAEGLALLLEALGCEDLPATGTTEEMVSDVLASLAARIDAILAKPVEEVIDLLPNLIYFLNTNGVAAVVDNTIAALTALLTKLEAFGLELNINELVNLKKLMKLEDTNAAISLDNLTLEALFEALGLMLGLDLSELTNVLVPFAIGEAVKYDSVSASDAYKMVYRTDKEGNKYDKHDMLSVIVTAALKVVVENEDNAAKLDEMLNTDIVSALKKVFASAKIEYVAPNWNYPLADNGTVDAMKYSITYPNNWTEATAEEVTKFLLSDDFDTLITGLIDKNYATLSDLLKAKVNVFTTDNLQAIVDLIANLLKDIDEGLLEAAGVLLGADVVGLKAYKAPAGITTVDAFAAELANVLNTYAKGVVEWLLLGNDYTFFVKEVKNGVPVDFITINGAQGYAEGLALLLEALGCKNLPAVYGATATTEEIVTGVLASLAARINEIFADPVNEIVDLLPNLFYFLNTNGVAAVVDNTTAALTELLEKLSVFGLNLNINKLVNIKKLMKIDDTDATISLDNLAMKDILQAVSYMIKDLDITYIENILNGFALGKVEKYDSLSKKTGETKKMVYADEFDIHDMVTVLANIVLITLTDAKNAEFVKGLVGEGIYAVILDILNLSEKEAPIQYMDWQGVPEKVGQIFNALETSPTYKGFEYGPLYTKEMAQYIADNIGDFIDNIIYLLGLEINGVNVDSLESLLNNLVGGSLYNSDLVITIRDALAGLAGSIEGLEVNGVNVGKTIVTVLAAADIADLEAIGKVEVPTFSDDKTQFIESICDVLEPAYGLLTWLLADEDLAFFVDLEKNDFITLPGAEGYRNGIALLLEAIGCKNLPTELNGEGDALVKAILNPLLNRLDEIFANPAEEILAVLTNVIYFINSKGVDVVIKNTLNAVYTVLAAIEPIAKVDLYKLVGLDAYVELTAEELIDMLLSKLEVAGFDFTAISVDLFSELTIGKLEAYDSVSDQLEAYKMVYDAKYASKADMVTAIMRLVITFILTDNNREVLIDLLKDVLGMSADAEKYVTVLLDGFADVVVGKKGEDLRLGMDSVLATIYYIFYGLDTGVDNTVAGKKDLDKLWSEKIKELGYTEEEGKDSVGNLITDIFDILFNDPDEDGNFPVGGGNDVADKEEIAPNGFIAFFQRIAKFFEEIGEFFRNLFSFGK